jgi:hypothetical protein
MLRATGGTWGKHIKDVSTLKGLNVNDTLVRIIRIFQQVIIIYFQYRKG